MEKELFRISINLETENREFIESDYKTTLEWNKDGLSYYKKVFQYVL